MAASARIFALALMVAPTAAFVALPAAASRVASRASVVLAEEVAPPPAVQAPSAYIEFIIGIPEPCVPDVSLTRSKDGSTGVATFTFDAPSFLDAATEALGDTTGMYLKDSEGTMKTSEVTATFTNGKPRIVKGVMVLKDTEEWDRFMRCPSELERARGRTSSQYRARTQLTPLLAHAASWRGTPRRMASASRRLERQRARTLSVAREGGVDCNDTRRAMSPDVRSPALRSCAVARARSRAAHHAQHGIAAIGKANL